MENIRFWGNFGSLGKSVFINYLDNIWRKRVGVEPTKDWLTAPPGFEVRTFHRERFPSTDRSIRLGRFTGERTVPLETARIDPSYVTMARSNTLSVKEL